MKQYRNLLLIVSGLALSALTLVLLQHSTYLSSKTHAATTSLTLLSHAPRLPAGSPSSDETSDADRTLTHSPINSSGTVWGTLPQGTKIQQHHIDSLQAGNRTEALIRVGDQAYDLSPNQVGAFEQITVSPNTTIIVHMAYPNGQAGDIVALEAEDGGLIDKKGISRIVKLDDNKQLSFDFGVNREEGIYRVLATKGGDTKMLAFWVSAHR